MNQADADKMRNDLWAIFDCMRNAALEDPEVGHVSADELLIDLAQTLNGIVGAGIVDRIVEEYRKLTKWYA